MALTMFGCSGSSTSNTNTTTAANGGSDSSDNNAANGDDNSGTASSTLRKIYIGTWWEAYYTSDHSDIYDNDAVTDVEQAQMQLDNMRAIEQKYNIELHNKNLTWDGTIQSINVSILSGKPDADVYQCDLQFGVPAVLKGYAQSIQSYADADSDIFNDQTVMQYLHIEGTDEDYLFQEKTNSTDSYCLAFNMDLIKKYNLENPQDLYDRGEWTWDKWMEYMKIMTEDTDNDGKIDQYGYCGYWTNLLTYLLMSNNTDIAATAEEHLDSPATLEVIQFIDDMYNKENVAYPWDGLSWEANESPYTTGKIGFWTSACWIMQNYGDSDPDKISFEVGVVPWPRGYSVEEGEEYPGYATAGNWYFIPKYIDDAELVYNVMFDWKNWFDYNTDLRDSNTWYADQCYSPNAEDPDRNYTYMLDMASRPYFDIWGSLDTVSMYNIICADADEHYTAAQYVEANKQLVQDAIDGFFK
jgi:hypothetical protein